MTSLQTAEIRVLGLDPSLTSFGVARLRMRRAGVRSFTVDTKVWKPKLRGVERLEWFNRQFCEEMEVFNPTLTVIEGYAYSKGYSAHQIGELGGLVRLALHLGGDEWLEVAPAKLKKFVTGKGNAPKDQMMVEAYKRFKIDVPTSDECDAAGLALFGAVLYGWLEVSLPKANMDALTVVDKK